MDEKPTASAATDGVIDFVPTPLGKIALHGEEGFEGMRRAGSLAAEALDMLVREAREGITTDRLDSLLFAFAMDHGAIPAPLHYRGFPKSCCTSLNHVVCHGIPGDRVLRRGDIVNIDVTLIKDGWHGDTSRMVPIGKIARRAELLIETTYEAMMRGIKAARVGARLGAIGSAIESYVAERRMSVVRDFCGHGIGRIFHDEPAIFHYGRKGDGEILREGMFFTVEPMVNLGKAGVKILSDGWTAVTRDKSLSAQFEHTIGVTAEGCEIFTLSRCGRHCPPYGAS